MHQWNSFLLILYYGIILYVFHISFIRFCWHTLMCTRFFSALICSGTFVFHLSVFSLYIDHVLSRVFFKKLFLVRAFTYIYRLYIKQQKVCAYVVRQYFSQRNKLITVDYEVPKLSKTQTLTLKYFRRFLKLEKFLKFHELSNFSK